MSYILTKSDVDEIVRDIRALRQTRVGGTNSPQGIALSPDSRRTSGSQRRRRDVTRFLATITESTAIAGYNARWSYSFSEVAVSAFGETEALDGGRSGTAMNLVEQAHGADATVIWGVDTSGESYPDGFSAMPVATGEVHEITERTDGAGNVVFTFEGYGTHDGTCDSE
jgi:hypothetical protein